MTDVAEYAREVEAYLCQKNRGHLVRVVGPAFELVCGWATGGVPLRIAFRGIDRCCERHQAKGQSRRPVRIEFCAADVLDAFDDWRRAVGVASAAAAPPAPARKPALAAHIERAIARLANVRGVDPPATPLHPRLDEIIRELEALAATAGRVRGEARQQCIDELERLDRVLMEHAVAALSPEAAARLRAEAAAELQAFAARMPLGARDRATDAAFVRLVREQARLPILASEEGLMLQPGQVIELAVEKPAAGGRMIARHEGQVVLVQGAIPGERVRAAVQRVEKQLSFAQTMDVVESSADRRAPYVDPLCGGCLFAHIAYPRQVALKGEIVRDAFARLGRMTLPVVRVAPSPEEGYRLRARFHARGGRIGFYREGTHELCDAAATRQMTPAAVDAAVRAVDVLASACPIRSVELSENLAGTERVLHVEAADAADPPTTALDAAVAAGSLTGCSARAADGRLLVSGVPAVRDPLHVLTGGRVPDGVLERRGESFFQANRFLLPALVGAVMDAVPAGGDVLDLYAGVGLFAVALAASGRRGVTAVEGDRSSAADLQRNAAPHAGALAVHVGSVEEYLKRRRGSAPDTVIVDPPRSGISRQAIEAMTSLAARRVVYVSCDPATMARDARRLTDAGYRLASLECYDLFPNTPHVESVGIFERASAFQQS